ncbi:MAG: hypothetical protein PHQ27_05745 [Victivallales bacterium]|nr:hypothetical protein [Victivallales bacterium]
MKRWLILFLLAAGTIGLWADSTVPDRSSFYRVNYGCNYGYSITTKKDADLSARQLWSYGYDSFGYFTFDRNYNIITQNSLVFDKNNYAAIGKFDQGTNIGFWLENDGNTYYSVNGYNGPNNRWVDNTYYSREKVFESTTNNCCWYTGQIDFQVDAKSPVGQPLPGVLISAVIGLAGLTGWRLRRRNS